MGGEKKTRWVEKEISWVVSCEGNHMGGGEGFLGNTVFPVVVGAVR